MREQSFSPASAAGRSRGLQWVQTLEDIPAKNYLWLRWMGMEEGLTQWEGNEQRNSVVLPKTGVGISSEFHRISPNFTVAVRHLYCHPNLVENAKNTQVFTNKTFFSVFATCRKWYIKCQNPLKTSRNMASYHILSDVTVWDDLTSVCRPHLV